MSAGTLTFNLAMVLPDGELPRAQLQEFLDALPEHAVLSTDIQVITGDRPWESTRTVVTLTGTWSKER